MGEPMSISGRRWGKHQVVLYAGKQNARMELRIAGLRGPVDEIREKRHANDARGPNDG